MHLRLDHRGGEPIYRQIVEAIKYQVASGELAMDEQLPSIRVLAGDLKINPRTVVKAYDLLEEAGLVVSKHGQGVFVAENHGMSPAGVRRAVIGEQMRRLLAEAYRLGASPEEVAAILAEEREKMEREQ